MKSEESGKRDARQPSTPGLMTRGKLQKLQGKSQQKPTMPEDMDEEGFKAQIRASMGQPDPEKFAKMPPQWYPQQMWPPGQFVRMPEGQKLMSKQPNFFINPHMPPNLAHMPHLQPQLSPPNMPMGNTPNVPMQGPMANPPSMPIQGQMVNQVQGPMMNAMGGNMMMPMQGQMGQMNPKMAPMMLPMRRMQFGSGSPQARSPMGVGLYPQMYKPFNPKSPSYIKQQVIRNRYSRINPSPKSMDAFLTESLPKEENVDLDVALRDEVKRVMQSELERMNNLHSVQKLRPNSADSDLKYVDPDRIVEVLIEGFKPVLEVMWLETKKFHQYSLDHTYHRLSQGLRDSDDLVVLRDFTNLKSLFEKRDEIEKLMASYRNISRISFGNNYFTFSSLNTANPNEASGEAAFLSKAMEYADVASNQKLLMNNVTALDFRSALSGQGLINYLPKRYRKCLVESVNSLHFDLGTPPSSSPKLKKQEPAQEALLNKVYDTLQSFQNSEINRLKPAQANLSFAKYVPNYNPYPRDDRLKEINKSGGLNKSFNMPQGMNMFPNLAQFPPNLGPLNNNLAPMNPNMPQTMPTPHMANFNLPPGVMPKAVQPHLPPTSTQFYNK